MELRVELKDGHSLRFEWNLMNFERQAEQFKLSDSSRILLDIYQILAQLRID